MNPINWLILNSPKIMHWFEFLLYLFGLGISLWAYRHGRKSGYLLVGAYFLLAACALSVVPAINRAIGRRWEARVAPSAEAQEQFTRESLALYQKCFHADPPPSAIHINFPLGAIALVAGIYALARYEVRRNAELIGSDNAAQSGSAG